MGLDLYCGSCNVRVGSYSGVHHVRNYLINLMISFLNNSIKSHIKTDSIYNSIDLSAKKELLESLKKVISNGEINYNYLESIRVDLTSYNLDGFLCFIIHSDCEGIISSTEASDFIQTFDIVKENITIDSNYLDDNEDFYLLEIFKESANSGEDIIFA